jgi:hypothetical protein
MAGKGKRAAGKTTIGALLFGDLGLNGKGQVLFTGTGNYFKGGGK